MIVAPAVDIRGGRCVQLVGGRPEAEAVSLPDPAGVARRWWDAGFRTLHVVDLDAALASGSNRAALGEVLGATPATTQVGGGIRDEFSVRKLVAAGADRVILGTRAVDDPSWLEMVARELPGRVMVAADVRDRVVLRRGWTETSALDVVVFVAGLESLPLAGVLCTDVSREGRLEGIDPDLAGAVVRGTRHPVWMSGGIRGVQDLARLEEAGAAGAVVGMALYTGALDPEATAKEFGG